MKKFRFNDGTIVPFSRVVHDGTPYNLPGMQEDDLASVGAMVELAEHDVDTRFYDVEEGTVENEGGAWLQTWVYTRHPVMDVLTRQLTDCWGYGMVRLDLGSIEIETSDGAHSYGTDKATRDNIQAALLGVVSNLTPNPRPWTPKGETTPISVTHDDIKIIAGALGAAFDAQIQQYLVHKSSMTALAAANDFDGLVSYDYTADWPVS